MFKKNKPGNGSKIKDLHAKSPDQSVSKNSMLQNSSLNEFYEVINSFFENLLNKTGYQEVVAAAVQSLKHFSGSPAVALFEYNKDTKQITPLHGDGFSQSSMQAAFDLTINNSTTGKAISTKQIQILSDLYSSNMLESEAKRSLAKEKFSSLLAIPIVYKNEPIGAASLMFTDEVDAESIDKVLLLNVGKTIALAMQNAKYIKTIEMENQLRLVTENRYEAVVKDQTEFIFRWLPDGTRTFVNDAYCRLVGQSMNKLLGKKWVEEHDPQQKEMFEKIVAGVSVENPIYVNENVLIKIKGSKHFTNWTNRAIFDDDGNVLEFQSVGVDLTEAVTAKEQLEKSQQRFYKLFQTSPNIILISDIGTGKFFDINDKACELLGYSRDELIGKTSKELGITSSELSEQNLRIIERDGHFAGLQGKLKPKNGPPFNCIFYGQIIELEHKEYLFQTIIDVSLLQAAEKNIRQSEEKFNKLFVTSPNLIAIATIDEGRFIEINDRGAKILGYKKEDILGKSTGELKLIPNEMRKQIAADLADKGYFEGREFEFKRGTGEKAIGLFYSQIISISGSNYFFHTMVDVTERKRAERLLIESENKYRAIVENQKDLILKFDIKGKILFASSSYLQLFGVEEKDIIGRKFSPDIHPEDYRNIKPTLQRALKPPYLVYHEERMKTKTGWRWIAWSNKPVENKDGTVTEIVSVGHDIDERKKAEIDLVQSEERFRNLINSLPDLVIIGDYKLRTLFVNQSVKRLTGFSVGHFNLNDGKLEHTHPDDRDKVFQFVQNFVESNARISKQIDNRFYNYKGEIRWHSSIITKIVYNHQPALLFLVRDITDRKYDEEEIKKLALIAREINNGVTITGADEKIEWVNEAFENITGYKSDEVKHKKSGSFLQGKNTNAETVELIRVALKKQQSIKTEILNYKKSGEEFWNELTIQPVFDSDSKLIKYIGIMTDVTKRKLAENELQENQAKLRSLTAHLQNVRERERQDIASGIHDELGQILTALKMNIKLMQLDLTKEGVKLDRNNLISELDTLSNIVDESVKSAKRIIKDLRPELLDKLGLIAAIEQHLSEFCHLAKLNYEFNYNTEEFEIDQNLAIGIFRTVQEALNNTVKYAKAKTFSAKLSYNKTSIDIILKDDGIGFNQNSVNQRNSFGLFGMNERILNFGGDFKLESKNGKGTKISIFIPL